MGYMQPQRPCTDLPFRAYLAPTLAYRRKAFHMPSPWYLSYPGLVIIFFLAKITECDKSFTRSDALAKHMRLQHSLSPPPPGRGGNRKRKRGDDPESRAATPSSSATTATPFNTFKVEPVPTPLGLNGGTEGAADGSGEYFLAGAHQPDALDEDGHAVDDADDALPPRLAQALDPQTGLIMGRSPAMVQYLLTKAKHRWLLDEHEALLEELRVVRYQEGQWREHKDAMLSRLLVTEFRCVIFA